MKVPPDRMKNPIILSRAKLSAPRSRGKALAARKVIRGAEQVARFAVGVYRKVIADIVFKRVAVNGEPGVAVFYKGQFFAVMTIRTDGAHILDVYGILNPDKLRAVEVSIH